MNNINYVDTDSASSIDKLGVKDYVQGLKQFIEECGTPMSISIRGEWGIGKTSLLTQIDHSLNKNDYISLWFNTWQFAQIGYSQNMTGALLKEFVNELEVHCKKENKDKFNKLKINVAPTIDAALKTASLIPGFGALSTFGDIVSAASDIKDKENKEVKFHKEDIQEMINLALQGKKKLIVFIDDLDRLTPTTAVSLLEGLKVFLDCNKCVFILAIDDSVVYKGVNKKYDLKEDDEKAKMFFDKIIQVPFRVPVEKYNFENYIGQFVSDEEEIQNYLHLLESFPRTINKNENTKSSYEKAHNPRTIKRAFNLRKLNYNIYCIQNSHMISSEKDVKRYLFFKHMIEVVDESLFKKLIRADYSDIDSFIIEYPIIINAFKIMIDEEGHLTSEEDINVIREDIKNFMTIMQFDSPDDLYPEEFKPLETFILSFDNDYFEITTTLNSLSFSINNTQKIEMYNSPSNGLCIRVLDHALLNEKYRAQHLQLDYETLDNEIKCYKNKKDYNIIHAEKLTIDQQNKLANHLLDKLKAERSVL